MVIDNPPWLLELLDSKATYHQYHAFQKVRKLLLVMNEITRSESCYSLIIFLSYFD